MSGRSLAIVTLAIVTGVPTLSGQGAVRSRDEGWIAPSTAAARRNPIAARRDLAQGGARLFQQRCATCHGPSATGTEKAPDLTASGVQAQTDGALFWKITSGNAFTGMPTFSNLPEGQRWQLVVYLRQRR